jgi:hypothetical protein
VKDGRPDLWLKAGAFAKIMNRTRATVYNWYADGTLKEFGYSYYRDVTGMLYIRVPEEYRIGLDKLLAHEKAQARQIA